MLKDKMEWAIYTNKESREQIEKKYEDLDKEEYESKYKNHLTCINGCKARIKFTQKKNDVKFFSTWNGDGIKHEEGCPFNVEYKNKIGRNKLKAFYEKRPVNNDDIKNTLLNKIMALKRKYNGEDSNKVQVGSNEVENNGERDVSADYEEGLESTELSVRSRRAHNITSIDAKFLSAIYASFKKCVYGIAGNAQIGNSGGTYFGYINLKNKGYDVSVYFPEAFYSQENGINLDDFKKLFKILKVELNDKNKKCIIVCYGEIRRKNKKGININIINDMHIYINDMSIRQILSEGKLREINYDIV